MVIQKLPMAARLVLFISYTIIVVNISLYMYKTPTALRHNLEEFVSHTANIPTNLDLKNCEQVGNYENSNKEFKSKLDTARRLLRKAANYARGTKARDALTITARALDNALRDIGMDSSSVTYRRVNKARSVCEEIYNGTKFGKPLYDEGFQLVKCDHHIPEDQLLTIVTMWDGRKGNLTRFVQEVKKYNHKMAVIIGLYATGESPQNHSNPTTSYYLFQYFDSKISKGHIWNKLTASVNTPYVLIARDKVMFNSDSRLHRLIGEIERLDLIAAGGASRDMSGHWKIGCLQRAYKNQTLVFEEGYYESLHECQFCDHIESSFVISTKTFLKTKLDETLTGEGIWEDFFMRIGGESVICPDSMFYVNQEYRSTDISDWKLFGRKYELKKLKFVSMNLEFEFGCPKDYSCTKGKKGYAVEICCLQELTNLVTFVLNTCVENKILCELTSGTMLGAVKFQKVLPWERDADIAILTTSFTKFKTLRAKVGKTAYKFIDQSKRGWFRIDSKHWFIEIFGQSRIHTVLLNDRGLSPTKLLIHGQWMIAPRNPGLYARNRYGHEIYRHAEHWRTAGFKSSWINYNTDGFPPCTKPGSQNCLNRYNSDGNFQFRDPIP